jgi:predicted acyltransferase
VRERLLSLDAHRGLAVIGMILVDWHYVFPHYAPFDHAKWLGVTPADFVFPAFLFAMGMAIPFSLGERKADGAVYARILRRAVLLFAFGMLLNFMWEYQPNSFEWSRFRLLGLLQRYALAYPIVAVLYLKLSPRALARVGAGILVGYWALLTLVPVPGFGAPDLAFCPEGGTVAPNLATWVDMTVLGAHAGSYYPHDPEGLLSTPAAAVTGIIGALAGIWLRGQRPARATIGRLVWWGAGLLALGLLWSLAFPLCKKLWTSSFVLLMGGFSLLLQAGLHHLLDVKRWRRPFGLSLWYGANALALIVFFAFLDTVLRLTGIKRPPYELLARVLSDKQASLVYSLFMVVALGLIFRVLYRRRMFLRV